MRGHLLGRSTSPELGTCSIPLIVNKEAGTAGPRGRRGLVLEEWRRGTGPGARWCGVWQCEGKDLNSVLGVMDVHRKDVSRGVVWSDGGWPGATLAALKQMVRGQAWGRESSWQVGK